MDNQDDNSQDGKGLDFETGPKDKTVEGSLQNPSKQRQPDAGSENRIEPEERFNPFEDEETGSAEKSSMPMDEQEYRVDAGSAAGAPEGSAGENEDGSVPRDNEYEQGAAQVTDVDYEDYDDYGSLDSDEDLEAYDAYLDSEEDIEDDFLAPPSASRGKKLNAGGNKSRLIVYGALGVLVLGAGGYFLLGGSEPSSAPVANVATPPPSADTANLETESQQNMGQQGFQQPEESFVDPMAVPEDMTSAENTNITGTENQDFAGAESGVDEFGQPLEPPQFDEVAGNGDEFAMDTNFADPVDTANEFQDNDQVFDTSAVENNADAAPVVIPDDVFQENNDITEVGAVEEVDGGQSDTSGLDAVQADMVDTSQQTSNIDDASDVEIVMPEETAENAAATPPQSDLPAPAASAPDMQGEAMSAERNVIVVNNPQDGSIPEDVFFDATIEALESDQAIQNAGPSMVDPRLEPGSRFVVVENIISANSLESELIAAERASTLGRYEAALGFYNKLYTMNKRDPRILMGRAIAMQKTGRAAEAIQAYEELIALHPNNADAVVNLMGLLRQENPAFALERLMSLRQQYPGNVNIAAQIGLTYADMRNFDEALRYLGIASSLQPENAMHHYNMAIVSERRGNIASAISYYEKALEVDAIHGNSLSVPRERIYDRLSVIRR